jgi:SAM-dependent methyltransferase
MQRHAARVCRHVSRIHVKGHAAYFPFSPLLTLCSIPDVQRALTEMRRVLKPHGQLLFVEPGRSPDVSVRRWQDGLTPLWKRIGGGCHLNRAIRILVEEAGFHIEEIETGYMKGPRPMTFMYEGRARVV